MVFAYSHDTEGIISINGRGLFWSSKRFCKFERKTHRDRRRKKNKDTRNYTQKRHSIPIFWWSELKSKMYSNYWILSNVWLISFMKPSVRIVVLERVRMNINTQISSHCAEESEIKYVSNEKAHLIDGILKRAHINLLNCYWCLKLLKRCNVQFF